MDLRFFTMLEQGELESDVELLPPKVGEDRPLSPGDGARSEKGPEAQSEFAVRTANDTNSRAGSRGMKRSESDILADPDIWNVDSSDDDSDPDDDDKSTKGRGDGQGGQESDDASRDESAVFD